MKGLLCILLVILTCSCSPIKGYTGPVLPEEKLSILHDKDCYENVDKIWSRADNIDFERSGISLLPGSHNIQVLVEVRGIPTSCTTTSSFDREGYEYCLSQKQQAIQKNTSLIPSCDWSSYGKVVERCEQLLTQFYCEAAAEFTINSKYDLCVFSPGKNVVKAQITNRRSALVANLSCRVSGSELRNVEHIGHF